MRGKHKMNADSPRHLRQTGYGFFDVARVEHHQIGEFVDDDDNVGNRAFFGVFGEQAACCNFVKESVVLIDITHTLFG